ncbi:MAG: DMT family transporter [Nitratireductor sp.]|jgi:transporter family-2 protein|nr:DMT family transporter [Nitratireductor sp.]
MSTYWLLLIPAFLGGIALSVQAPINAAMGRQIGDGVTAGAISFAVGFLTLSAVVMLRGSFPGTQVFKTVPWWMWTAGCLGGFYVWSALWSVQRIGAVSLVAALVCGQLLAAMVVDTTGAFGLPAIEISWQRIAAVLLVGSGLVLSRMG